MQRILFSIIGVAVLIIWVGGVLAATSAETTAADIQVNTYTTGNQYDPSAVMGPAGNFVMTQSSNGQHGDWWGVYAQLYNSAGNKVGYEFKVNTYTTGTQFRPSIAMDADGSFVITWSSISPEGSGWGVYAQRYDSSGIAIGQEFQVNTPTTRTQSNPSAAMDANGNAVIAWTSKDQDSDGFGLFMKILPY